MRVWLLRDVARRLAVLAVVFAALATVAIAAEQDTWANVERIVAVGDLHGDCEQFAKALSAAGVIDDKNDWAAGKTHLVQLGDVLDRGPDSRRAMDLLMKLEAQAAKAGGAVHPLLGNHEAMVVLGDWRYLTPEETASFGGEAELRKAMSPQGVYGKWIRSHNTVVKINGILFAHAGIGAACARKSLAEINQAIRQELQKGDEDGLAMSYSGPLWNRSLALGGDEVAKELDAVLKKYGASRMVVGHTPSPKGIHAVAGGRLLCIDVGMSRTYLEGPATCLVIEKGDFYEVTHPKVKRKLDFPAPSR